MRAQPRRGKGFVDVRAAFVAQREAAEAMQPDQGAFRQRPRRLPLGCRERLPSEQWLPRP